MSKPGVLRRAQVGVAESRLRKWLLSVSAYLRNQNGGVAQAVTLWKRNVDREFEGEGVRACAVGSVRSWVQANQR